MVKQILPAPLSIFHVTFSTVSNQTNKQTKDKEEQEGNQEKK